MKAFQFAESYNIWILPHPIQGFRQDLGNWVCKILARCARNSFIFILASFAAQKQFLAHLLNIGPFF